MFMLRGANLHVFQIYVPPNLTETEVATQLKMKLQKKLQLLNNKAHNHFVINRDFNSIINPILDKTGNTRKIKNSSPLIKMLQNLSCIDSFRSFYPHKKKYI